MTCVFFAGPTLSADEARAALPSVRVLPPAAQGDVYRAARQAPEAIAICDGYFDQRLSIWHKEVLWALSQGIRVYGAASMGALRAAELEPFGMIGVGEIFKQYRSGSLEDDDEVALAHAPAEQDYRPRSEALVNMRATLRRATEVGVVSERTAAAVLTSAKALFYPERTYARALELARTARRCPELDRLSDWLDTNPGIDQKRLDALEMLERVRQDHEALARDASQPNFRFEATDAWRAFCEKIERESTASPRASGGEPQRLGTSPTRNLHVETLERTLALVLAELSHEEADASEVQRLSEEFRKQHGLQSAERTQEWLEKHRLDQQGFSLLMYNEALIQRLRPSARELVASQLPSTLQALNLCASPLAKTLPEHAR